MTKGVLIFYCSILFLTGWGPMSFAQSSAEDLFQEGKARSEQGNFSEAVPLFRSAYLAAIQQGDVQQQANAQIELARAQLYSGQTDDALKSYLLVHPIAQENQFTEITFRAADAISQIYSMRDKYAESIPYFRESAKIGKALGRVTDYTASLSMVGFNLMRMGQMDSALWYMTRALAIKKELGQEDNIKLHYNHLANFYLRDSDFDQALDYHIRSLRIMEADKDSAQIAMQYHNIADLFMRQKNIEKAEYYAQKALQLAREQKLSRTLAPILLNLGHIRSNQDREEEALAFYEESLIYFRKLQSKYSMSTVLSSIGQIYLKQGFWEQAELHFQEALSFSIEIDVGPGIINTYLDLVNLKIQQKQGTLAKQYLDKAWAKVQEIDQSRFYLSYYSVASKYFESNQQYKAALASTQQHSKYKSEVFNLEQSEVIHNLEERYERAQKDKEIAQLNVENEFKDLNLQQSQRNNMLAMIGLVLAGSIMVLLYFFNRSRRMANDKLAEKNTTIAQSLSEKEILLKEIHHRVKNNLQVISSLLRLQSKYIKDEKALHAIQEGRNRVKSMAMIHQNLYREDNLTGISVGDYIQKLSESLFHSYNIDPQRIQLTTDIDRLHLDVDTVIPLGLILNELLTNALKYAFPEDSNGQVAITLKQQEQYLLLEVKDNGIGIEKDVAKMENSGFGLKLIDTFAQKLKAKLEIEQESGTAVRLLIHKYKIA